MVGDIDNDGKTCLLYTSDAADERSSVDLGGRRIIKKKKNKRHISRQNRHNTCRTDNYTAIHSLTKRLSRVM